MEDKKDYLVRIYHLAVAAKIIENKKTFAQRLGVNPSSLSNAFQGDPRYLSEPFMQRVKLFAIENGLEEAERAQKVMGGSGVWLPEETRQIFENMSETIRMTRPLSLVLEGWRLIIRFS